MNLISTMVGLSIMGAAAPSMMTMSIAPFEAQKRAQNLGVAESAAVTYAAANEGQYQLVGSVPEICERTEISVLAYEIKCTEEEETKYEQTVIRAFRLRDQSCDNDGNNGHGNSGGNDCSNPGNGNGNNTQPATRTFNIPPPPGLTGHQCQSWTQMGTSGYGSAWNGTEWTGDSCTPQESWNDELYEASEPDVWYWDITGVNGRGIHPRY